MRYSVIIPTLNPGKALLQLADTLRGQTMPPEEIVVADSESEDGFPEQAAGQSGVRLIRIRRKDFDHGGTRDRAMRTCGTPFVVMMTQDALPVSGRCMEELLKPFADGRVAAVCGRQIAYPEASPAEKAVRAFRYPAENDVWGKEDIPRRGVKAYLLSDVCAAYRVSAYEAVGGFASPLETNEDMLIAADFLDAGFFLAYRGEAAVYHSHQYTLRQEYERNRKIGIFLGKHGSRFGGGGMTGEGLRLVQSVSRSLVKEKHFGGLVPFWLDCGARWLGSRNGKKAAARRKTGQERDDGGQPDN